MCSGIATIDTTEASASAKFTQCGHVSGTYHLGVKVNASQINAPDVIIEYDKI